MTGGQVRLREREPVSAASSGRRRIDVRFATGAAVWLIVLLVSPSALGSVNLDVAVLVLLALPGAIALNMLQGIAGQVSVGNAALMGVGGFAAATFTFYLHVPFLVALCVGTVAGGLVGAIVAIPALRVRGLYLLLATLALQFVATYFFGIYQTAANQPAGFSMPTASLWGYQISSYSQWYWLLAIVCTLFQYIMVTVKRSRIGRSWMAIRESEQLAASKGINVPATIVVCFAVTSAIIGLQGVLVAYQVGLVDSQSYSLSLAIAYLTMVLVGGEGSTIGPILGAVVVEALPYLLNNVIPSGSNLAVHSPDIQQFAYGLLIVLVLIFEPEGLAGLGRRFANGAGGVISTFRSRVRQEPEGRA